MLSSSVRNKIMRGGLIGQRRQLSDPKIYPMYSSISKDGDLESKYERVRKTSTYTKNSPTSFTLNIL